MQALRTLLYAVCTRKQKSFIEEKETLTLQLAHSKEKGMDWNGSGSGSCSGCFQPFVSPPQPSLNFLCNFKLNHEQYAYPIPGMEMKHHRLAEVDNGLVPEGNEINSPDNKKKKKFTNDQLDCLERSFQEETTLDPERKMKLSMELGLQPRQIAIWFQNRRSRWKAKQLEHSYGMLKQNYEVISRENQKLQHEVMKLKGMLMEQAVRNPTSTVYTDISGAQATESTMIADNNHHPKPMADCTCVFNGEGYSYYPDSFPVWSPSYP